MIYDVNSPLFRSFLSQKGGGGSSDKRKQEEQKPKDQKPKLNLNIQMEDGYSISFKCPELRFYDVKIELLCPIFHSSVSLATSQFTLLLHFSS
ncbi:Wound-induced basic protein-like protein [Drosera capensis]